MELGFGGSDIFQHFLLFPPCFKKPSLLGSVKDRVCGKESNVTMFTFSGAILHSMATRKITQADVGYKGTQLKMTLMLEGGQRVVFKPKWWVNLGDLLYLSFIWV